METLESESYFKRLLTYFLRMLFFLVIGYIFVVRHFNKNSSQIRLFPLFYNFLLCSNYRNTYVSPYRLVLFVILMDTWYLVAVWMCHHFFISVSSLGVPIASTCWNYKEPWDEHSPHHILAWIFPYNTFWDMEGYTFFKEFHVHCQITAQ